MRSSGRGERLGAPCTCRGRNGRARLRLSTSSHLPPSHGVRCDVAHLSAKDTQRPVRLAAGDVAKVVLASNSVVIDGKTGYGAPQNVS